ncbi:MAG: heme-copper oxidase subunit III [Verrucomicrobiaceae bacterium]|nr:heme-copper oxidase subunit III [Verrucomicrobiaceae bacterium]
MDIPYTVHARPDTGLYNAKVGIWLFLASEVMLFGGLFSSYIFLRLGADYPWPIHELDWTLGGINTVVLIASSVTVVWAWAAVKMRKHGLYKILMLITILCAAVFMVNKTIEYTGKLNHWSVTLTDGSILSGHLPKDEKGHYIPYQVKFEGQEITLTVSGMHRAVDANPVDYVLPHIEGGAPKFKAAPAAAAYSFAKAKSPDFSALGSSDWELNASTFAQIRSISLAAAREAWKAERDDKIALAEKALAAAEALPEGQERAYGIQEAKKALTSAKNFNQVPDTKIKLVATAPFKVAVEASKLLARQTADAIIFRDGSAATGKLLDDKFTLEADALDLRSLADQAREKSLAFDARYLGEKWQKHFIANRAAENKKFDEKYSDGKGGVTRDREKSATFKKHAYGLHLDSPEPKGDHGGALGDGPHHPVLHIESKDITFFSNYTPKLNTYYAIYFTLTGLHGLHVVAGALVLAYFLVFNGRMLREDPEHLANRIEVGGLFWHFVDLIWIFLFPLLYLL